jgi:hypothetical protein
MNMFTSAPTPTPPPAASPGVGDLPGVARSLRRQGAAAPPLASVDLRPPLRLREVDEKALPGGEGGMGVREGHIAESLCVRCSESS